MSKYYPLSNSEQGLYISSLNSGDAYNLAKEKDNLQLAKIIDKYNHDSTNIEQNIDDLKNKKKELEKQIKEINRQIKMLK